MKNFEAFMGHLWGIYGALVSFGIWYGEDGMGKN
jgi:hypothetical protein